MSSPKRQGEPTSPASLILDYAGIRRVPVRFTFAHLRRVPKEARRQPFYLNDGSRRFFLRWALIPTSPASLILDYAGIRRVPVRFTFTRLRRIPKEARRQPRCHRYDCRNISLTQARAEVVGGGRVLFSYLYLKEKTRVLNPPKKKNTQ
jgi:hypothetical protein